MITHNLTLFAGGEAEDANWKIRWLRRLVRMRYQLLGGMLFGVVVPVLLRAQGVLGPKLLDYQNSTLGTFAALIIGFIVLRKTTSLPGSAAFMNVLPAFILSFGTVMVIFFGFRLEYSRYQFLVSFILTVMWFYAIMVAFLRARRPSFGIIASGTADRLRDNPHVDVVALKSVADAERLDTLPLVADFSSGQMTDEWERYLAEQAVRGRSVFNARHLVESLEGKVQLEHLTENSLGQLALDQIYRPAKQYVDTVTAFIALILLSPLMVAVGLAIRLDTPGPALFKQTRVGFRGRHFTVYKFRSMRVQSKADADLKSDMTKSDDDRITRVGAFLRKSRLDELPQLINVLRGEMSWIGPRPETLNLSSWYEEQIPFYRIRHAVRPGITGWAQVRQGHVTSVDDVREKLQYDLFYVKNFSVWFDVLIVIHTIRVILTGSGAK